MERILERRGWTEGQWWALDPAERNKLWAYELTRQQMIERVLEQAVEGDKPFAEVVTVQLLAALLRMG